MSPTIAPLRGFSVACPWEGNARRKPWNYAVTAVIPCLDTADTLRFCVELLRMQTERPYIVLIDTGSTEQQLAEIQALRAEDVEVHSLRLHGVLHPSDFPAIAMDLGFSLCRTEHLFATHADVFLRRRGFLADLIDQCSATDPVVGYQISPRAHPDWRGMVSHTATIYHIATMDRLGFGWSQRRLCNIVGLDDYRPNPQRPNWPDTELLGNYLLRMAGIVPFLIGEERNFVRHVDENLDHCRSLTSARLYSPEYLKTATKWTQIAIQEARERIEQWKKSSGSSEPASQDRAC
jgi:glycosyltransferase involved in cell wall biosynthesis